MSDGPFRCTVGTNTLIGEVSIANNFSLCCGIVAGWTCCSVLSIGMGSCAMP
jgi:hypothetical protein